MRASLGARDELAMRVQQALALPTKKEAEMVLDTVVTALEATLLNSLGTDGFTLKLGSFGKFYVRHKPGAPRSAFWYVGLGVLRPCFRCSFQKNKKAGILGSGLKYLKLVAGVRFELTTFGL